MPQSGVSSRRRRVLLFNYLGQLDQMLTRTGLMRLSRGEQRAKSGTGQPALLPDRDSVRRQRRQPADGMALPPGCHSRDYIETWADGYLETLTDLVAHCCNSENGGYTPADFPSVALGSRGDRARSRRSPQRPWCGGPHEHDSGRSSAGASLRSSARTCWHGCGGRRQPAAPGRSTVSGAELHSSRTVPLSAGQAGLWFLNRIEGGSQLQRIHCAPHRRKLDVAALCRSLSELVRRHEALRTVFPEIDGSPVQTDVTGHSFTPDIIELEALPTADIEQRDCGAR